MSWRELVFLILLTLGLFFNLGIFVLQLVGARRTGKALSKKVWARFILYNLGYAFYVVVRNMIRAS